MAANPLQQQLQAGNNPPSDVYSAAESINDALSRGGSDDDGDAGREEAETQNENQDGEPDSGGAEEASTDAGGEGEEGSKETETEVGLEDITDLRALETALGADAGYIGKLNITLGEGDDARTMPLSELFSGYHTANETATQSQKRLTKAIQEHNEQQKNTISGFQATVTGMRGQLQAVHGYMAQQMQSEEHARLRFEDPAEWTARQTEYAQLMQAVQQTDQQLQQTYAQSMSQAHADYVRAESEKLSQMLPKWDRQVYDQAMNTIMGLGFSQQEAHDAFDSRFIVAALKFSETLAENKALKERIKKGEKAAKTVKKNVPKLLKPGKGGGKAGSGKRGKLIELNARAKRTGRVEDAGAAIAERLFGDQ